MAKKKILIIVFSVLAAVVLAILATLIGLNYKKIEAWFNGSQLYTYDELQKATQESYNKGVKDKESLLNRNEKLKIDVRNLSEKVASLTADNNAKTEELIDLKSQIVILKKIIDGGDLTENTLSEELAALDAKLTQRLKSMWNKGYNEGFNDGFQSASLDLPANSFALVISPNLPVGCSSDFVGSNEIIFNNVDTDLYLPTNQITLLGYNFKGYSFESDASIKLYSEHEVISANTFNDGDLKILYCIWEPISYTVNFKTNLPANTKTNNFVYTNYYVLGSSCDGLQLTLKYDEIQTVSLNWSRYAIDSILGVCAYSNKLIGWALTPDGDVVYSREFSLLNLTSIDGDSLNLYAVYETCDLPVLVKNESFALLNSQTKELLYFVPEVFIDGEILPNNIGCYIVSNYTNENLNYLFSLEGAVGKFAGREDTGVFYITGIGRLIFNGTTNSFFDLNSVEYSIIPTSLISILN